MDVDESKQFLAFIGPSLALQIRLYSLSSLAIHMDLFRPDYSATEGITAYVLALPPCTLV